MRRGFEKLAKQIALIVNPKTKTKTKSKSNVLPFKAQG
jgi:hypothetical protein